MNFAEAIELSKKFPSCHPKVFRGFAEWGVCDTKTGGYVVLADEQLQGESLPPLLEDYIKRHRLRINRCMNYLMICSV